MFKRMDKRFYLKTNFSFAWLKISDYRYLSIWKINLYHKFNLCK